MTTRPRRTKKSAKPARRTLPVWPILIGAIVVAGILAVVFTSGGGDGDSAAAGETAPVEITGAPLPRFTGAEDDPAIGEAAPVLDGSNFAGEPVTIPAANGNAKAVFFVAHWCPHCQDEIPRLAEWLETHDLPTGLELSIVSTRVGESDDNSPASEWLDREGVGDLTVMVDDDDSAAYSAYGAGGLPYVVYLDKDNNVVLRTAGEYQDDPEVYTELFENLAAGNSTEDPRL